MKHNKLTKEDVTLTKDQQLFKTKLDNLPQEYIDFCGRLNSIVVKYAKEAFDVDELTMLFVELEPNQRDIFQKRLEAYAEDLINGEEKDIEEYIESGKDKLTRVDE